jgi:hypothetical protein
MEGQSFKSLCPVSTTIISKQDEESSWEEKSVPRWVPVTKSQEGRFQSSVIYPLETTSLPQTRSVATMLPRSATVASSLPRSVTVTIPVDSKKGGRPSFPPKLEEYEKRGISHVRVKVENYFPIVETLKKTLFLNSRPHDSVLNQLHTILSSGEYSKIQIVNVKESQFTLKHNTLRSDNPLYTLKYIRGCIEKVEVINHQSKRHEDFSLDILLAYALGNKIIVDHVKPEWLELISIAGARVLNPFALDEDSIKALTGVGLIKKCN